MKTIILRLLQVVLLAVLVIIGVNVLEPLRPVKLSEEKQAAAEETVREIKESMKADSSSESGNTALENRSKDTAALENKERIACIDDNEEALVLRLRMIEAAKESLVFATFDFRADESGSAMMAAFYAAAERGVKVSLLLDGMNEFLYLERSELFKALCTHENVEVRVYNPIDAFHILKGNYRMHDKYLITDDTMYLLGGRNSNDIFLGDRKTGINADREIFVYEPEKGNGKSFQELEEYFASIWEESCVKEKKVSMKEAKKEAAEAKLLEHYQEICEKYPELWHGSRDRLDEGDLPGGEHYADQQRDSGGKARADHVLHPGKADGREQRYRDSDALCDRRPVHVCSDGRDCGARGCENYPECRGERLQSLGLYGLSQ